MVIRKAVSAALAASFMTIGLSVSAFAADFAIQQTECKMPYIHLFVHSAEKLSAESVQAYLDHEPLEVSEVSAFSEAKEPIHYYYLLDDTGSVPKEYIPQIQAGLKNHAATLRSGDRISLFAIGDSVRTLYDGTGKDADFEDAVNGLDRKGQKTLLYEALVQIADTSKQQTGDSMVRNVIIAVSDGVNESVGTTLYEETMEKLKGEQLPVYAVGLGTDQKGLDSFGQLARSTNGSIRIADAENTPTAITETAAACMSDYYISLKAPNNIVGGERELLVKFKDGAYSESVMLHPTRWEPDNKAPKITETTKLSDTELKIIFDENVSGAEDAAHYSLTYGTDKTPVSISKVQYSASDHTVLLTTGETLIRGDYLLKIHDIRDVSQEQNLLADADEIAMTLEGPRFKEKITPAWVWKHFWWILPILLLILLAVIVLRHIRKNKGLVTVDGQLVFGNAVDAKVHVKDGGSAAIQLQFSAVSAGSQAAEFRTVLQDAVIVGRSQKCQVYFDDARMSRQHFRLQNRGGQILISDCGSLSGTKVNGKLIQNDHPLQNGDVVQAGMTEITIRW